MLLGYDTQNYQKLYEELYYTKSSNVCSEEIQVGGLVSALPII